MPIFKKSLKDNGFKFPSFLILLFLIATQLLLDNAVSQSDQSPTALGEEKYQELKSKGLLLHPKQVEVPKNLRQRNMIKPSAKDYERGLLIPLDETFNLLHNSSTSTVKSESNRLYEHSYAKTNDTKCGTSPALQDFRAKIKIGSPIVIVRPTLSGPEITIDTQHFRIHYTTSGNDATTATYASDVANYAENSWSVEVTNLSWDAPPGDGTIGGGNDLYDVYIRDIAQYLGVTHTESPGPDPMQEEYTSYIEINIGINTALLQVTVAHEFNHSCQFSYSAFEASWWYENTATWMEDQVYDGINDYLNYLTLTPSPLTTPEFAITSTTNLYEYGGAIWTMFLQENHGIDAPRQAWERMGTNFGEHTLEDLDWTLSNLYNSSLNEALQNYAIWRYFTGNRDDAFHFSEGSSFPAADILITHNAYPAFGDQGTLAPSGPGGTNYIEFINVMNNLQIQFDGQDGSTWSADIIEYRAPSPSPVENIMLGSDQSGGTFRGCTNNNSLILVATVKEWNNSANNLNHNYSASEFTVVPFTNGNPPEYRNDDGSSSQIPLSFPFFFYGTQYNDLFINNNGNISFGAPYFEYTPTGFPDPNFVMIAPFWGDVDTRNPSGESCIVFYKSESNRFTIIWHQVGYYSEHTDKLNTFQLIITDGNDPLIGIGNNVCFAYADMQWTTGDASGGIGGFGGSPATVGANKGDGVNYALVGRFDHEGFDYDGAGGNPDGVSYLDNKRFYFNVGQGAGTIAGTKFRDDNGNCVHDPGEPGIPGWTIRLDPGAQFTTTDNNGEYFFSFLEPNTYTVSEVLRPNWQQICPPPPGIHTVVLSQGQTVTGLDFGNQPISNVQDLTVSVAGGPARPGFIKTYGLRFENKGTVDVNGSITLFLPQQVTYLQSSPVGVYDGISHSVTWNQGIIPAGLIGFLSATVQIPTTIPPGTLLTSTAQIDPLAGDISPFDNTDSETQTVTGSYDPNDKQVSPQGFGPNGIIATTDTLDYLIRFQNVGTDTAFNIIVRDMLDPNLDLSTVVPGASSHPYTYGVVSPRELVFSFPNIELPDSNASEAESHGFIKFSVLPDQNANPGTDIFNNASIYFDFNPPVVTNTVRNRIADPGADIAVSPSSYDFGDVSVCSADTQTFTITNEGIADLVVSETELIGSDSSEFSIISGAGPFTLMVGESQNLAIGFEPISLENKNCVLRINSNDLDETPFDVPLSGRGIGESNILGDVDEDTLANSTDAVLVLTYDVGLAVPPKVLSRINLGYGNVNASMGDTLTNSTDALFILSYDVGKPVPFPIGVPICLPPTFKNLKSLSDNIFRNGESIRIFPMINSKQSNEEMIIDAPITVDMSNSSEKLGSYTAKLEWDPTILKFISYSGGRTEGFNNPMVNSTQTEEGKLIFAHANPNGADGEINILNVKLKIVGSGALNSSLSLNFSAMTAAITYADLLPYLVNSDAVMKIEGNEEIPLNYSVENYPNPFNPTSHIRFGLPQPSHVKIEVFNVLGERVSTLLDAFKAAGYHEIGFDGSGLASGIYVYRIQADEFDDVKKMILMK